MQIGLRAVLIVDWVFLLGPRYSDGALRSGESKEVLKILLLTELLLDENFFWMIPWIVAGGA
jgi:hypothetical protein